MPSLNNRLGGLYKSIIPFLADIEITTPSFDRFSFVRHPPIFPAPGSAVTISLSFTASSASGLLFYVGNFTNSRDFLSISLMDQRVEFRYDLGSGPAILISQPISLNTWYDITAYRLYREGQLTVNGSSFPGVSPGTTTVLNVGGLDYFVGGVEQYSIVSPHAGTEVGLTGCMDNLEVGKHLSRQPYRCETSCLNVSLQINGVPVDVIASAIDARGVGQCSDDPCADSPCENGGTCQFTGGTSFMCLCPLGFAGTTCDTGMSSVKRYLPVQ